MQKTECPFKDLEFPDLSILNSTGAIQLEQIESVIRLVWHEVGGSEDDLILSAALAAVLRLLDYLRDFLGDEEKRYNELKEEYNKKRALAEVAGWQRLRIRIGNQPDLDELISRENVKVNKGGYGA